MSKYARPSDNIIEKNWKKAQATEMNRFFGWALFSIRRITRKRIMREMTEEDEPDSVLTILKDMSVFEHEIVDNEDYLEKYYAPIDRIYNEGWLTLVSPKFADLGHEVMISIVGHIDIKKVKERRGECVLIARKEVEKDVQERLMPTFLELTEDKNVDEDERRSLFLAIVRKTFNSRVGGLLRYYKSIKLNRGTKGENNSALREEKKLTTGALAAKKRNTSN